MNTIRETIVDLFRQKSGGYRPYIIVHGDARTLDAVNAAISDVIGDPEPWFEGEDSMQQSIREGFLSFHADGFIIWADEGDYWRNQTSLEELLSK